MSTQHLERHQEDWQSLAVFRHRNLCHQSLSTDKCELPDAKQGVPPMRVAKEIPGRMSCRCGQRHWGWIPRALS